MALARHLSLPMLGAPRALRWFALLYAVLPSIVPAASPGAGKMRILCASGALLGAIPALLIGRRAPVAVRVPALLLGGVIGALFMVCAVAFAFGESPARSDILSWALLFPALSYGAATMLLLASLGVTSDECARTPVAAALMLAAFGLVPLGNALTGSRATLWYPVLALYWMAAGGALWLALLTLGRWMPRSIDRVIESVRRMAMESRAPIIVGGAALFAFAASAAIALYCFGRQPHNADEVAQLWHARILASGRLALPPDANPEFFGMDNVIDQGAWYSQFPIGGPAFLALGLLVRAAWLVNPLLLALTLVNLYRFARRAYGESTARASALLFALSPFALFMGASFMNHVPMLWLLSIVLVQLTIWVDAEGRSDATRSALRMGLCLGVAATIRPLDTFLMAGVIGVLQLTRLRGSAVRVRSLAVQVAAGAVPIALLLVANAKTTGAPFHFGYDVMYGSAHGLGFHIDPYGTMHSPLRALLYASKYLLQLNMSLLEAPLPAVGIIVVGLLCLRRPSRWDLLLLALLAVQLTGYALYWHEGDFRGPRFLFTVLPAIIIFVARAPLLIAGVTTGAVRRAALMIVPVCVLVAWSFYGTQNSVPGRVMGYRGASLAGRVDPDSIAQHAGLHHALVFVSESFNARALRRLWALGIPRGEAIRMVTSVHPCSLREAIAAEATQTAPPSVRLGRMVRDAPQYGDDAALPEDCVQALLADDDGVATYAPFFPANTIGADGRVGGNVIYVLDHGAHDETLRTRFGDRTWYRFGPHLRNRDDVPRLTPYTPRLP